MEDIKAWVTTLSGIILFGSLCEMVLPAGNFQKYIRLVIGIFLVLALMSPVYSFLKNDITNNFFTIDVMETYTHSNMDMEKYQKNKIISLYKEKLGKKISESVSEKVEDFSAQIKLEVEEGDEKNFGIINRVVLITETDYSAEEKKQIKKIITNEYGVSESKIIVLHLLPKEKQG